MAKIRGDEEMAWYDEAVFYHIYPLGLTGAPKQNDYGEPVSRLRAVFPWIAHIKEIGCNAIYIGPLFESVGHGYETTDYKKLDSRLGTNRDLVDFVKKCHEEGIHVILDGVFNHTGRDFFAFRDISCCIMVNFSVFNDTKFDNVTHIDIRAHNFNLTAIEFFA